ncbi:hypothetical protein DYE50_11455 [Treponema ruminis]|uniref:Nucleotidyltransferase n=1 Tax=Treponema ruminis TaxID=744515 RepID=A0A7W8LM01_9SPIR|nr:hypothetical protein [Treponema ruminis]MBB5225905.1 hypothetical protein [Treponema ruminis]QSI03182.1 hypothetical protein DYE50_11455 [Treponema ruminis]
MFKFVSTRTVKRYKSYCADILNQLKMSLINNYGIEIGIDLIGSGAKNLVTQNENEPFDLDFNLIITSFGDYYKPNDSNDLRELKDLIRNELNEILEKEHFRDAQDSKSVLTARLFFANDPKKKEFSFDIAILARNSLGNYCRLIHEKGSIDRLYWNEVPSSHDIYEKSTELKEYGWWQDVRETYLKLKNMYLQHNDHTHPSFIVYVEAVNKVYNDFENYDE